MANMTRKQQQVARAKTARKAPSRQGTPEQRKIYHSALFHLESAIKGVDSLMRMLHDNMGKNEPLPTNFITYGLATVSRVRHAASKFKAVGNARLEKATGALADRIELEVNKVKTGKVHRGRAWQADMVKVLDLYGNALNAISKQVRL